MNNEKGQIYGKQARILVCHVTHIFIKLQLKHKIKI